MVLRVNAVVSLYQHRTQYRYGCIYWTNQKTKTWWWLGVSINIPMIIAIQVGVSINHCYTYDIFCREINFSTCLKT